MRKILLIEDQLAAGANTREILALSQYMVLSAADAAAAVALALKEQPELMICDLSLPGADPGEIARALQREPTLRPIPLLVFTEASDRAGLRSIMTLGADDYLVKPFDGIELLRAVDACLERQKRKMTQNTGVTRSSGWLPGDQESHTFKKKTQLYTEGQRVSQVWYVVDGKVKTYRVNSDGKELITGIQGAGDCVGYAAALVGGVHTDNAQILEDAGIVVIPRQEFLGLFNSDSALARQLICWLARHAGENEAALINLAYSSLRKKVANGILSLSSSLCQQQEGRRYITISRDNLAAFVGSAPESLTRTLGDFRKEGLIDISDGRIWLVDEEGLRTMVN